MLQTATLQFLKDLKKNNNKAWFDANRPRYEAAKNDVLYFVQSAIDSFSKKDKSLEGLIAKNCLFRINRDVRFSKDKSPYKTNFGASINAAGKKSSRAGYYIHIEPGNIFVGGGLYQPLPEELGKVRQEIDYNYPAFKKILQQKKFKELYGDLDKSAEFSLTRIPKGYEAGHPAAEYLKLKSFIAMIELPDKELTDKTAVKKTVSAFDTLQPLIEFINRSLD